MSVTKDRIVQVDFYGDGLGVSHAQIAEVLHPALEATQKVYGGHDAGIIRFYSPYGTKVTMLFHTETTFPTYQGGLLLRLLHDVDVKKLRSEYYLDINELLVTVDSVAFKDEQLKHMCDAESVAEQAERDVRERFVDRFVNERACSDTGLIHLISNAVAPLMSAYLPDVPVLATAANPVLHGKLNDADERRCKRIGNRITKRLHNKFNLHYAVEK